MESLPTEQSDIERLSAEPATGTGAPIETATPAASPVAQSTPPPVSQTPQPQFDPPIATPLNAPKKSHKKRNIIIAIVILLLLAGGAVAAVMAFSTPKKDTTKKAAVQDTKPLDDAQGMITKINAALTDSSKDTYQNPQISFTSPTSKSATAESLSYQVKDTDYYVTTDQTYGLNIQKTVATTSETGVDTVFTQGIVNEITAIFASSQYKKTTEVLTGTEYQSDAVICTVSGVDTIPVYVTCANKNAYTKISSDLKPFVVSYRSGNPDDTSETVFSAPTIKSTSVSGYQTATVAISSRQEVGSKGAFFYRKDNADWKFFKATQSLSNCSDYNTDDLKAAFADETCVSDSNTNILVKDYTPGAKKTSGSSNIGTNSTTNSTTQNGTTQNTGIVPPSTNQ